MKQLDLFGDPDRTVGFAVMVGHVIAVARSQPLVSADEARKYGANRNENWRFNALEAGPVMRRAEALGAIRKHDGELHVNTKRSGANGRGLRQWVSCLC